MPLPKPDKSITQVALHTKVMTALQAHSSQTSSFFRALYLSIEHTAL